MKITGEGGWSLLKEWTILSLSRVLVIKPQVADAPFLVSVVELTPFLSISVCLVLGLVGRAWERQR